MSVGFGQEKSVEKFKDELEIMSTNKDKDVFLRGSKDLEKIERRLNEAVQPKSMSFPFPSFPPIPSPPPPSFPSPSSINVLLKIISEI